MNKTLVLYSNYTKFEFEMIGEDCIVENSTISISDALEYARKMSYPYNLLRGDIFTVKQVLMHDGKTKDIYTLLESLKFKKDIETKIEIPLRLAKHLDEYLILLRQVVYAPNEIKKIAYDKLGGYGLPIVELEKLIENA